MFHVNSEYLSIFLQQLRLLIVDDHPLLREGLVKIIKLISGLFFVDEAGNGLEAIELCALFEYDIIFLDLSMPLLDGIEVTKHIKVHYPNIKIIILTMHHNKHQIIELMELGVSGYLFKESGKDEISNALEQVCSGRQYLTAEAEQIWEEHQELRRLKSKDNSYLLFSEREIEIIRFLCQGYSAKDIAEFLNIAESTVNNHRNNIFKKMNVDNVVGLVNYAHKHGIVLS